MSRNQVAATGLATLLAVASAIVLLRGGLGPAVLVVRSVSGFAFIAAGAVTWLRGGATRLGWLFVLAGSAMCLTNLTLWPGPVLTTLRVLSGGYVLFGIFLVHLLLAYPEDRVTGRLARFTVVYGYLITAVYMLGQYLIGNDAGERYCHPISCASIGPAPIASARAAAALPMFILITYPVALAMLVIVFVGRWRRSAPSARRLLRPVLFSLVATFGLAVSSGATRLLVLNNWPAARIGIAVVWGLTVCAIAVALLAGVLRNRLVLYGMEPLVSQLSVDGPGAEFEAALARLLQEPSVRLLRRPTGGDSFFDLHGHAVPIDIPGRSSLLIGDPPLGAITYDMTAQLEPRLARAAAGALVLVLTNLRLQDKLRENLAEIDASRGRILEASDAERRRVERDLHDGAQQHLVATALNVQQARRQLRSDPLNADRLLGEAEAQLRTALLEIRDLARGLHPAILSQAGIGPAVESLADRLPLRLDIRDNSRARYSTAIETTAYFTLCESLVNVVKHSGVRAATVCLVEGNGFLVASVEDEGSGGADAANGTGLRGLADRVHAVGGRFEIISATGGGTTVRATLPIERTDVTPSLSAS